MAKPDYIVAYFYRETDSAASGLVYHEGKLIQKARDNFYEEKYCTGTPEPEKMELDDDVLYFSLVTPKPLEHDEGYMGLNHYETYYFPNAVTVTFAELSEQLDATSLMQLMVDAQMAIDNTALLSGEEPESSPEQIPYLKCPNGYLFPFVQNVVALTPLDEPDQQGNLWRKTTRLTLALNIDGTRS